MRELSSDHEALFTPPKFLSPHGGPSTPSSSSSFRHFVIEPPLLTPAQKSTYKFASDTSLKPGNELKVDEVIGEYRVDGILYYFARHAGGIAYKVSCRRCHMW